MSTVCIIICLLSLILVGVILWRVETCACKGNKEGFETDCAGNCNKEWVECVKQGHMDCGPKHNMCLNSC